MNMEPILVRVWKGELSFDSYVHATRGWWQVFARSVRGRWDVPQWLTVEDVQQEMLFAAWRAIQINNPSKGSMTTARFVILTARLAAERVIHKARLGQRPHRGECSMGSRYEIPDSFTVRDNGEDNECSTVLERASVQPVQEELVIWRSELRELAQSSPSEADRLSFTALSQAEVPTLDGAVSWLRDNHDVWSDCEFDSEEHAECFIRHSVERVVVAQAVTTLFSKMGGWLSASQVSTSSMMA